MNRGYSEFNSGRLGVPDRCSSCWKALGWIDKATLVLIVVVVLVGAGYGWRMSQDSVKTRNIYNDAQKTMMLEIFGAMETAQQQRVTVYSHNLRIIPTKEEGKWIVTRQK